jgi:hypothetical protein
LGIQIPDPDPGARKLRNFSGIVILKKYKIALTTSGSGLS